jgi:hypothetical protein
VAVHIYTQTVHRTTQITTNVEECGPCPVFASFTLAFALQLRKKHGKTSVRARRTSVRVQYTYYQNTHTLQKPTHTFIIFIIYYYYYYYYYPCHHGIYNYLPESNHVSREHSVAAVLYLQSVLHVMLFRPVKYVLYFNISTLRSIYLQCSVWLFSVVP